MQIAWYWTGLIWGIGAWVVGLVLAAFIRSWRRTNLAREWRTQDPPFLKARLPFGIDLVRRILKADKEMLFPVDSIKRVEDAGAMTYKYSMLGSTNVFTADPKNIQAVLATQFSDYDMGPERRGCFFPLLGDGIFTQDGRGWEKSRAMMRPQFARELVSDLGLEERHVQNLMQAIVTKPGDDWTEEIDLQTLFFRLTLDSATEFLFGKSVDSQIAALPSSSALADRGKAEKAFAFAFDKGQAICALRTRLLTFYYLYNPSIFRKCCRDCHEYVDQFVQLALSKGLREKELEKGSGGKEKYVFLEALAQETRDPIELRSQVLHTLLAGRDTTASLLGWLTYSLARDPARYTKLRNVILDQFGSYDDPKPITFAKLKSCAYLQHCMSEALRLYPVVASNLRAANKDTTMPRGGGPDGTAKIFVPKGTLIEYSVHVMHHRKDIWGPDAEDFIPERWEGRKVGWEYLPFNGGPRICIGQQFALTEASYVTVRLLQRFSVIENRDSERVHHNLTLVNCSGKGVRVRLRE